MYQEINSAIKKVAKQELINPKNARPSKLMASPSRNFLRIHKTHPPESEALATKQKPLPFIHFPIELLRSQGAVPAEVVTALESGSGVSTQATL